MSLTKLHFAEIRISVAHLAPKVQAVEGYKNNRKQRKLSPLFDYIFKWIFASSDSFLVIASHALDFNNLNIFKGYLNDSAAN